MAAEKGEKGATATVKGGETGVTAADEEKGATAVDMGVTAADEEKGATMEEKGVTTLEKGEKGAMAAAEEKGATAEGKGKKRETTADEKDATAEWGWKWNGLTAAAEEKGAAVEEEKEEEDPKPRREPRRWRNSSREKGAAVDKEQGSTAAASEAAGKKEIFVFSTPAAGKTITLVSSEGKPFKVSEEAARLSVILADMIDNGCADGNIPLHNVTARALVTVIKYCDKHAAAAKPDSDDGAFDGGGSSSNRGTNTLAYDKTLAEWDRKLLDDFTMDALYEFLLAANFLDIKGLLGAASQKVADMIQSKTPAQVRTIFGIVNDFTPEEEAEIRNENLWAYEDEEA